jgi:hypothetical protein
MPIRRTRPMPESRIVSPSLTASSVPVRAPGPGPGKADGTDR